MKTLYQNIQPNKTRLTLLVLFGGATVFSVVLFRLRTILSGGSEDYMFLLWNIFLAWIPLGLAYMANSFSWNRKTLIFVMPFAAILWLLFFPNAPYILTDLLHLAYPREYIPVWFDVLLILWFSWTGLSIGIVSLFMMQDIVRREFGHIAGWGFVGIVGLLTSLGIYIGRFLRWNSWDVILNPQTKLMEFLYYATHPSLQSIIFITIFAVLFIFIYITVYTFGLLLQEQTHKI